MPCAFPMFRLDFERASKVYDFPSSFENRVHNKGVMVNKDEAQYFKELHPLLSRYIVQVPCGKCIQCRLSYSRDWANRCMAELKTNPDAIFLTLTYDDDSLTFAPFADVETGTVDLRPCLVPRDLQLFLKRLRIRCQRDGIADELRFYACGEYGETTLRPHYHLIIFGLRLPAKGNHLWRAGDAETPPLWTHTLLTETWPHGLSCYGQVTWETCAYTARYVMKKKKGVDRQAQIKAHELLGLPLWPEEFVRMSRRPGLGRDFYELKKGVIYATDEMFVPIKGAITSVRPCRYFDRLYDVENHENLSLIKARRSLAAEQSMAAILARTDLTEEEYLLQKDAAKIDQSRRLVRPDN